MCILFVGGTSETEVPINIGKEKWSEREEEEKGAGNLKTGGKRKMGRENKETSREGTTEGIRWRGGCKKRKEKGELGIA